MRNSEATGSVYEKLLLLCSFLGSPVSELPPGDFNLEFPKLLKGIRQGIQGLSCPEDLQEMALCSRRRNQSIIVYLLLHCRVAHYDQERNNQSNDLGYS